MEALRSRGGTIAVAGASGSAVTRLASCLGMDWQGKEDELEQNLLSLVRKGRVTIERRAGEGTPINSIVIVKVHHAHATTNQRQRVVAVVSGKRHLPQELTTVLPQTPAIPQKEDTVMTRQLKDIAPTRAEQLTLCLNAVQLRLNEQGKIVARDVREALREDLQMSDRAIERALELLGKLGLRTAEATAFQTWTHTFRQDVTEVTEAMLEELRAKGSKQSDQPVAEVIEASKVVAVPIAGDDNSVAKALRVIEKLEAKLDTAAQALEVGRHVCDRLIADKSALEAENASLRARVTELEAASRATSEYTEAVDRLAAKYL